MAKREAELIIAGHTSNLKFTDRTVEAVQGQCKRSQAYKVFVTEYLEAMF